VLGWPSKTYVNNGRASNERMTVLTRMGYVYYITFTTLSTHPFDG